MSDFERGLGEVERTELDVDQMVFTSKIMWSKIEEAITDRELRGAEDTEGVTVQGNVDGSRYFFHMPPKKSIDKEGE